LFVCADRRVREAVMLNKKASAEIRVVYFLMGEIWL
jgi:hypothetical protein